jgi:hypothetical protein
VAGAVIAAPGVRAAAAAVGVAGLLLLLTWTLLTDPSHLVADFPTDVWLIQHQAYALHHDLVPSLSLTTESSAFYPVFAFYGGTFFTFAGAIALVVGSATAAEVIVYLLALAAAYGGWLWLARMAGLRSWRAHAPAILYVTAPYVLTNINVRQDLTELAATAAIPPLLASSLSVLRADRLRAGPAVALAASAIVFSGTHNLTLLWGVTILGSAGLALLAGVPQARRMITRRGVLRVLAIVIPATAVNAWYLLPDLAYHSDTYIAGRIDEWQALLRGPHPELATSSLFSLDRRSAFPGSGLIITLPVPAMAWVAVAAIVVRRQHRATWARTLAVLALVTAAVLMVMAHPRWILALPDAWNMIQFSYRLVTFALLGICGAVIAALVLADHGGHRWLSWLLLPILAASVIGAADQRRDAPRGKDGLAVAMDTFLAFNVGDFSDARLRDLPPAPNPKLVTLKRTDVAHGRAVVDVPASPGDVLYTNLMTPSRMLHIEGARAIGNWVAPPLQKGWQGRGELALRVTDDATPGRAHLVITQARTLPIVGGKIISLLGLLGLAANAVVIAGAARRRRSVA